MVILDAGALVLVVVDNVPLPPHYLFWFEGDDLVLLFGDTLELVPLIVLQKYLQQERRSDDGPGAPP